MAKRGIIGKILMSRAHGRPLKFFKVFFYIFLNILKSLVVLAKIMPIANENRIGFVDGEGDQKNVAVADGYELLTAHGILYWRKIDDSDNFF